MLNAPFTTHFDKAPHMDIPLKMKKTPTPLQLQVLLIVYGVGHYLEDMNQ